VIFTLTPLPQCLRSEAILIAVRLGTPTLLIVRGDKTRGKLREDMCYIEEVPYMDVVSKRTYAVMVHHTDIAAMDKDEANAEAEKVNSPGYEILGH
jgi:hypothetical protein